MSLNFPSQSPRKVPSIPDLLAHEANDEARRAADVTSSREVREHEIAQEMNHPTHKRFAEAIQNRSIILYGFIALMFPVVLYLEWEISKDMYEVLLSNLSFIPFVLFAGLAFVASACFAEGLSSFALLALKAKENMADHVQSTITQIYDRSKGWKTPNSQAISVSMGLIVTLIVGAVIYLISYQRVEYQKAIGELSGVASPLQLYLPVFLFGVEVILGIPTFYFFLWLCDWLRTYRLRKDLTLLRDKELILRQSAIEKYFRYMGEVLEYNDWVHHNGKSEQTFISPNAVLRSLIVEDFGYDPTESRTRSATQNPPASSDQAHTQHNREPNAENGMSGAQESNSDGRIDDLLNVLDEQTSKANRSL